MSDETKKWLGQCANLLRTIREKYSISEEFAQCQPNEDFFDDSCNFVGLCHELDELEECLRNMVRNSEMSGL